MKLLVTVPIFLLFLLSLPQQKVDSIRSRAVLSTAPAFLSKVSRPKAVSSNDAKEINSLSLENYQLRTQLGLVYEWISSEKRLQEQAELFRLCGNGSSLSKEAIARRSNEMKSLLQQQTMASFAKIIYRDPGSWSSSCWINVGEENNQNLGQPIIAKNSPVVSGLSLVGVVEYVGKKQSRVRFITDSSLKTAVRAVRGSALDRQIASLTQALIDQLKKHPESKAKQIAEAQSIQDSLPISWKDAYLAKGEISGSSATYFRSLKSTLKGIGFNCDFEDAEGPARDLRADILHEGDLLVTSGLDGVFPPGLKVAIVTKVELLRPGAYAYQLEATPTAGDLADLSDVYVLPPISSD